MNLQFEFGNIDIYLFDQLLRGRLVRDMRVLDAGCGGGRNLVYLLREGFEVWGIDHDPAAVEAARNLAKELMPEMPAERFAVAPAEALPFEHAAFDFVICNAVLHFARDETHFTAMLAESARVLRPGGIFFARLMSTTGIESLVQPSVGRRYRLPDGQSMFLADESLLLDATTRIFQGRLADPLKSTLVHGRRTMTTWVVMRGGL